MEIFLYSKVQGSHIDDDIPHCTSCACVDCQRSDLMATPKYRQIPRTQPRRFSVHSVVNAEICRQLLIEILQPTMYLFSPPWKQTVSAAFALKAQVAFWPIVEAQ